MGSTLTCWVPSCAVQEPHFHGHGGDVIQIYLPPGMTILPIGAESAIAALTAQVEALEKSATSLQSELAKARQEIEEANRRRIFSEDWHERRYRRIRTFTEAHGCWDIVCGIIANGTPDERKAHAVLTRQKALNEAVDVLVNCGEIHGHACEALGTALAKLTSVSKDDLKEWAASESEAYYFDNDVKTRSAKDAVGTITTAGPQDLSKIENKEKS